jgi:hypothetical protein
MESEQRVADGQQQPASACKGKAAVDQQVQQPLLRNGIPYASSTLTQQLKISARTVKAIASQSS